jgi:hypothetical protein
MRHPFLFFATILFTMASAFAQDTLSVYDIQYTTDPSGNSPYAGQVVFTGGIVIGISYQATPIRYFIADRSGGLWHGILVNDNQSRNLAIGDSAFLQAEVQESSGQTRLRNVVAFASVPSVSSVPPVVVTTGGVGESAEGTLIEVNHAGVVSIGTGQFVIDDGSGPLTVGNGWSYQFSPLIGDTLRFIRGIVTSSGTTYTLNPRDDNDFGFVSNRPPLISNVVASPVSPTNAESDTVTAHITDETVVDSAFIYYRFGDSGPFLRQRMYDDGLHGDSAAGDGRWGGVLPAGQARTFCHYYISATDDQNATGYSPAAAPTVTYQYRIRSLHLGVYDLQYTTDPSGNSDYNGQFVTVTGIVTAIGFGGRSTFFMSDSGGGPWSGIEVYSPPSGDYAIGDLVTVSGLLQEYNSYTEFSSPGTATVIGASTAPDPWLIHSGMLPDSGEATEGTLIKLGRCWVTDVSDFAGTGEFLVNDGSGNGTVISASSYSFALDYTPAVGDTFDYIIGVGTYYSAVGWEMTPRIADDLGLIDHRPPGVVSANAVSEHSFNVLFNERIDSTGLSDVHHYTVTDQTDPNFPQLHVQSATLFSTRKTVHIETLESLPEDHGYQIRIDTLRDLSGNVLLGGMTSFIGYTAAHYVPIDSIYHFYSNYDNAVVTLRGVVNFMQDVTTTSGSRRISAYMQDESGSGFSLSQTGAASTFPGIQRGNLITITGTVTTYQGAIQLGSFTSANVTVLNERAPLPTPIIIQTGDLRRQSEIVRTSVPGAWGSGTWCQTSGTIYRVDENVGGGTNVYIDDGSGNTTIRIWDSMYLRTVVLRGQTYRLRELVGKNVAIAGPSSTYNGDFQMLAGYAEDFTPADTAGLPSSDVVLDVPNRPFAPDRGQKIRIYCNAPGLGEFRLRVFDLRGRLVTTIKQKNAGGPEVIWWDGRDELRNFLPIGTYILHLESVYNGHTKSTTKPIVIGTKL